MRLHVRLHAVVLSALAGVALVVVVPVAEPDPSSLSAQMPDEQRIEVVMHNYDFEMIQRSSIQLGTPTVLILRNQDIVRHGFASPAFAHMKLRAQGEGVAVFGQGAEGVHLDPGKMLVLYFVVERSGKLTFHCDLHPHMKGELLILDIPAA